MRAASRVELDVRSYHGRVTIVRSRASPASLDRPPPDSELLALLLRMPKAELHLHLDGSMRASTALELARQLGLDEGMDEAAMRRRLTAPMPCRNQAQLLDAFDLPISLLQDAASLRRVTDELVEDVGADGTRYVEIRWAPSLHLRRGLRLDDGIAAVTAGARSGAARTGIVVRLIVVVLRTHPPDVACEVTRAAMSFRDQGLTGFDCAGREAEAPDVTRFADAFAIARDAGFGITVHAGEWGGATQVRRGLGLQPARIAHGAAAVEDPELMAELRRRRVTLDLCPTSNVQAGIIASFAEHPLARFHRAGIPVTLSTDDRTVSDLTLVREYGRAVTDIGLSLAELWAIDRHALEVAFLHDDESQRSALLAEFDAFAAHEPLLRSEA
jgi:adenosine deaminase